MRRFRNSHGYNFWPSFVDALSTLLIVVLFFLLLFVLAHFFMGRNLDTKNSEIMTLNDRLSALSSELSAERRTSRRLTRSLADQEAASAQLNEELAGLKSAHKDSLAQIALLEQDIKALAMRRKELEKETSAKSKELKKERKISQEAKAHLALLTAKTEELTKELSKLSAALDKAEEKEKAQNAQIVDLGKKLNRALARKASELAFYRSDFFGTLRKVLEDREDIRIEGDRFVFQSELFFKSGSADLEEKGKKQLKILAKTLKEIAPKIPKNIQWILRVDGHTDNIPIRNEMYSSNWQLSANRAIAVVQFLTEEGVPAKNLAAAGFGEFQPIDKANTPAGRRKNRRIEFKLTDR